MITKNSHKKSPQRQKCFWGDDNEILSALFSAEKTALPLNTYAPNSGCTIIQAAELYRIGEKFEIHFLIENRDEMDKGKVWYLTIQGTDIREIVTPQNLMFREDLKKCRKKRNKNNDIAACVWKYEYGDRTGKNIRVQRNISDYVSILSRKGAVFLQV